MRITARTTITGMQRIDKLMAKIVKKTNEFLSSELEPNAILFRDAARQILTTEVEKSEYPGKKITRALEDSIAITVNTDKWEVTIGPDGSAVSLSGDSYAEWVEYGHFMTGWGTAGPGLTAAGNPAKFWPGYYFMNRAFELNKDKVPEGIKKRFKEILIEIKA